MQIVTDSGTDVYLTPEERAELNIHIVPLVVSLDGKVYYEGIDIEPGPFYDLLAATSNLPTTSQPSAGDFAKMYENLAKTDPDILSIHMTAGLSGTYNSAVQGAAMVPEANVTHINTKTLSAAAGWQVVAAAQAVKAGWAMDKITALIDRVHAASDSIYTLDELKYLVHGGRISHMKGLIASILNIKPMIGVEKTQGIYSQMGQARTFKGAVNGLVDVMLKQHKEGTKMLTQVLYSFNPEGGEMLKEAVAKKFDCIWRPTGPMSLVLGAHTGPSMVGVAYASVDDLGEMPAGL
jgi:DegV family protein with EDD domain